MSAPKQLLLCSFCYTAPVAQLLLHSFCDAVSVTAISTQLEAEHACRAGTTKQQDVGGVQRGGHVVLRSAVIQHADESISMQRSQEYLFPSCQAQRFCNVLSGRHAACRCGLSSSSWSTIAHTEVRSVLLQGGVLKQAVACLS